MSLSATVTAHRCFSIAEITSRIIIGNIHARHDLRDVALSCHAFLEPALDVLWSRLEILLPLLRLFPDSVVSYSRDELLVSPDL
jgi:hypothetical protein